MRSQLENVGAPPGDSARHQISRCLTGRCPREDFGVRSGRDGGLCARTLLGNHSFSVPTQPAVNQQDTIAAVQATMTSARTGPFHRLALQLAALTAQVLVPEENFPNKCFFHFRHVAHKGPNQRPTLLLHSENTAELRSSHRRSLHAWISWQEL